jgi:polar amino acid transport system substrate-binding protein
MLKTTKTHKMHLAKKIVAVLVAILCVIMISGCSSSSSSESTSADTKITTLDELNGKSVGLLTGASFDLAVQERLSNSDVIYYPSYSDAKIAVQQGLITAYIAETPVAQYQTAIDTSMYYIDDSFTKEEYGFVMNKDNTVLGEQVNSALAELQDEGVIDELEQKWMEQKGDNLTIERNPNADTSKGTINVITSADIQPCWLRYRACNSCC